MFSAIPVARAAAAAHNRPAFIQLTRQSPIALADCGLSRLDTLRAFEQAILMDPTLAVAYNNKGLALERLGKSKEARQAYKRARQLDYSR